MENKRFSLKAPISLLAASLLLGAIGGAIGAAFSLLIGLVTDIRLSNGWLVLLLPLCGVVIVFIYKKLGIEGQGTNRIIESADGEEKPSPFLSLGVFVTSVLSHLFGASVGREGAALQIGGSLSSVFSKIFRLDDSQRRILVRVGMAAVFSAVFGTPLTAFFFALEVVVVGTIHIKSVIPCLIASFVGYFTAHLCGAHPERFNLVLVPDFSLEIAWKIAILTVLVAALSIGFCYALRYSSKVVKKLLKSPYLRIITGGGLILILTALVGNQDYNGAGVSIIEWIFSGGLDPNSISFRPEAFALKLLFTCISVAGGFKGGEIVPTLFIGATFGALVSSLIGLSVPFGAALCMVLLFSGVTNCPLASIALSFELFSGMGFWYFVPTVAISFILSGKISLYSAQKHRFKYL